MSDMAFDSLLGAAISSRRVIGRAIEREGSVPAVVGEVRVWLGLDRDQGLAEVDAAAAAHGAFDELGLRRTVQAMKADGGKQAMARAAVLEAWLQSDDDGRRSMRDDYLAVFVTQKGEPRKNLYPANARKADPDAEPPLLDEQVRVLEWADRRRAAAVADRTRDVLEVARHLLDAYRSEKSRLALLDYDDLIDGTRRLLESRADWVHYKLDQGIDHILIDEAQDTSPDQWRIAELLSAEFFAGAGARPGPRTVFAVGDEKQSIYSFQGADPEGFDRMRRHFRAHAGEVAEAFEDVRLELSFRSAPEVLSVVDDVFSGPAGEGLTASDAPVVHRARRADARGLVEVWPLEEPSARGEADRWEAPLDTEPENSPRRRLARHVAGRIRAMIDDGETVDGDGGAPRPIAAGDVLILVRRRDALVEELARALKEAGVPVAGSDRMTLSRQIAVMDLIALGEFLLMPEDDLTFATVLKSPLFGLDDDDLFRLAAGRGENERLWPRFRRMADREEGWAAAAGELERHLAFADQTTPFGFFSRLLSARAGRRRLHARLGPDQLDPIEEFLNAALDHERDGAPSLQRFIHRMKGSAAEIRRDMEQERDAVRIMTVHGAKGLEAPVVFLPDTVRPPNLRTGEVIGVGPADGLPVAPPARAAASDRLVQEMERRSEAGWAEYNRLLYVAMTRARDRLYVAGYYTSERAKPHERSWYRAVRAALAPDGGDDDGAVLRRGGAPAPVTASGAGPHADAEPPDWTRRPAPDEPAPPRPLSPSRVDWTEPAAASPLAQRSPGGDGRLRGVLLHQMLQTLPALPAEGREAAGGRLLSLRAPEMTDDERSDLLGEAMAVMRLPELSPVFAAGSRAEAPLTGMLGGHVISGRVDRMAVTPEGVWIVDYKTNRPPPDDVADTPVAYLRQMALYRELMRRIYPGRPVICALVWTFRTRVDLLPDDVLDTAWASLDLSAAPT
jgi:ATP-dependent helicase/nuclease subunit A